MDVKFIHHGKKCVHRCGDLFDKSAHVDRDPITVISDILDHNIIGGVDPIRIQLELTSPISFMFQAFYLFNCQLANT